MQVLVSPQWSFGRDRRLLAECHDVLSESGLAIHYCESDIDHNRTFMVFSGSFHQIEVTLLDLCKLILPSIDLSRHVGVHPRIGALDVCAFTPLEPIKTKVRAHRFREDIDRIAQSVGETFELPVYLFEKSERNRDESDIPELRRGGFGGLIDRVLKPDFGPSRAHPHLGASVMGWRDFTLFVNVNLNTVDPRVAREVAAKVRQHRIDGDERMLGVRAYGYPLASRESSQVALHLTLPNLTPVDPVLEYVRESCETSGVDVTYIELVGVIRTRDLEHTTLLHPRAEQVIELVVRT